MDRETLNLYQNEKRGITVSKLEWGTKRTCQTCQGVFYDMKKDPIVCPRCKSVYNIEEQIASNPNPSEIEEDYEATLENLSYQEEEEVFLDPQEDFIENLEELEGLNDGFQPHELRN